MRKTSLLLFVLSLIITACNLPVSPSSAAPTATQPAMPTAAQAATSAPQPSATPAPTATSVPTDAPTSLPPEPITITRIEMVDAKNGWGLGETAPDALQRVLTTSDGGETWQNVTPTEKTAQPGPDTAVLAAFSSLERAWAIWFTPVPAPASEAVVVWSTTDRGRTWTPSEPLDVTGLMMDFFIPGDLGFTAESDGWLLAHLGVGMNHDYVAIYRTADGGQTWARVVEPLTEEADAALPMSCSKTGVAFTSAEVGWVSGNCNGVVQGVYFYQTGDGGQTWNAVELPAPRGQAGLMADAASFCGSESPVFKNVDEGILPVICMLADGSFRRWLYFTTDSGESWTPEPAPLPLGTLEFAPGGAAWLLGSADRTGESPRTLFTSPDTGRNWIEVADQVTWDGMLSFSDQLNGWVVAREDEQTRLLRTTDGGETWTQLEPVMLW